MSGTHWTRTTLLCVCEPGVKRLKTREACLSFRKWSLGRLNSICLLMGARVPFTQMVWELEHHTYGSYSICPLHAIVGRRSYGANPLQTIYMEGNFTKHWNEFQVISGSPQGSVKIESNQPVKIEIPHLLHDLIWFEVASFWSPSNKRSWLSLQEHDLPLYLLFSASSSSFFAFFFQASISENFPTAPWPKDNSSSPQWSWFFC